MEKINFLLKRIWLFAITILVFVAIFVWSQVALATDNELHLKFYDVGQGDSLLIQTPGGYNVLVDGGPNNKVVEYLNRDLKVNDRVLDLIVLTHPQADHMFGLIQTIKDFKVKKIITSGVSNSTAMFKLWNDTVKNKGLSLTYVKSGETITLSDSVKLSIIWPRLDHPIVSDLNEASVVIKLSYGDFDALLTGDADQKNQPYKEDIGEIEVLKVPHHGSKTALKEDFLKELSPEIAVFSLGKNNRYGHPGLNTLEMVASQGTKIFRTDQNGTVEIVSDGQRWYTRTER